MQNIFNQGDYSSNFYIISKGYIKLGNLINNKI